MVDFFMKNLGIMMSILFLISELLGENKKIKASSVFGLIRSFLKGEALKAQPEVAKMIEKND